MTPRRIAPAWGLVEICALAATYVFTLWVVGPHVAKSPPALTFYWIAMAVWSPIILWLSPVVLHRDPPGLRGWGRGRDLDDPGAFQNAWPYYAGSTALAALSLVAGAAAHDAAALLRIEWLRLAHKLVIYLVWGLLQAAVFFGYIQTRLRTALGRTPWPAPIRITVVVLATASLFALAHAPNWPLAALAFAAGLAWSSLFYARPNLVLLGLSHACLGSVIFGVLHLFTRIGPFYAHPELHLARSAIPGLKALVGDLF